MIVGSQTIRARASIPWIGSSIPTAALHLAYFAVAAGLCVLVIEDRFWLGAGLLLAALGTFMPNRVPKGCVILLLALRQFWRDPSATDVPFYLLLAGAHLLLVVASLAQQMPWYGRMQTRALVRPLRRFVIVQIVVQAAAVVALSSFGDRSASVPGLSIVAGAMIGVVAVVLARGLRDARGPREVLQDY